MQKSGLIPQHAFASSSSISKGVEEGHCTLKVQHHVRSQAQGLQLGEIRQSSTSSPKPAFCMAGRRHFACSNQSSTAKVAAARTPARARMSCILAWTLSRNILYPACRPAAQGAAL